MQYRRMERSRRLKQTKHRLPRQSPEPIERPQIKDENTQRRCSTSSQYIQRNLILIYAYEVPNVVDLLNGLESGVEIAEYVGRPDGCVEECVSDLVEHAARETAVVAEDGGRRVRVMRHVDAGSQDQSRIRVELVQRKSAGGEVEIHVCVLVDVEEGEYCRWQLVMKMRELQEQSSWKRRSRGSI